MIQVTKAPRTIDCLQRAMVPKHSTRQGRSVALPPSIALALLSFNHLVDFAKTVGRDSRSRLSDRWYRNAAFETDLLTARKV